MTDFIIHAKPPSTGTVHHIITAMKPDLPDPAGAALRAQIAEDLGIVVDDIRVFDVYTIAAELDAAEIELVRTQLLTDPVIQESALDAPIRRDYDYLIEVGFRPGVTDNAGRSAREGIQDTIERLLDPADQVFSSRQYALKGQINRDACETIARDLLANELIERWAVRSAAEVEEGQGASLLDLPLVTQETGVIVRHINLDVPDTDLLAMSQDMVLALDLREMHAIQAYYRDTKVKKERDRLGLPDCATDIELEILAQTWSEHCKHKIFDARITHIDEVTGERRVIDSLFKTYIKGATEAVAHRAGWLVSVFEDNAGIIRFTKDYHFALKCETHNSPSALDPYGGAITGIVGVNRDILGAGLGCRCIFNTDVFCFASPFYDGPIPPRLMAPRRVLRGVHRGVKDGGNQSGIPDINGAFVFHERFLGKPLVFCGTGGLIPVHVAGRPSHEKAAHPGDRIVMCGGRIGKDGIHGATFSSEELHEGSPATAVQIGDPITQKKMADFLIEARDLGLFTCITDNGAGGLSSSVGEMARNPGGAEVFLDRAPLKYAGLTPWEIFLSEAQERMTLSVPPEHIEAFMDLAARREVEATDLGRFTNSGRLECYYEKRLIGALDMRFLHDGLPRMELNARWAPPAPRPAVVIEESDLTQALKDVLGALNVCSKENFVRMYDHEVQGQSVLKQFQGAEQDGPGNAGVIQPLPDSTKGIAVACGICPKYSELDTYHMMTCAVDEAVRNLVSVGARLRRIAGLDNFCWPDPVESEKTPDGVFKLAQLVRCCEALYEACVSYEIPLCSGSDSMKNDYRNGDTKISIPPTVLFTAAAILDDASKCVSMDVKRPGDYVYLLGETWDELGGSEYLALKGQLGSHPPKVRFQEARTLYNRLATAMDRTLVASCHDCSDGGLGAALAETAFAGGYGINADLTIIPADSPVTVLFSESQSRFVVTVEPGKASAFEAVMAGSPVYFLGEVTETPFLCLVLPRNASIEAPLTELKEAWQAPLRW